MPGADFFDYAFHAGKQIGHGEDAVFRNLLHRVAGGADHHVDRAEGKFADDGRVLTKLSGIEDLHGDATVAFLLEILLHELRHVIVGMRRFHQRVEAQVEIGSQGGRNADAENGNGS